jgi:ABC-type antimicrobial peptide transport system permease subunit
MKALKTLSFKKIIFSITCLMLQALVLTYQVNSTRALDGQKVKIYGFVLDFSSNKTLCGAKIGIVERIGTGGRMTERQTFIAETNCSGFFEIYLDSPRDYFLFAYCDDDSTPGADYVPTYKIVSTGTPQYINFSLLPGASINLTGDPLFSPDEGIFSFEVKDASGILSSISSITYVSESRFSMRESRVIFVPANVNVVIGVNIFREVGRGMMRIANFTIPSSGHLNLEKGELRVLDLKFYRLNVEANINMPAFLESVISLAEKIGVLSAYERARISKAENLLKRARALLSQGDSINAQADLYEAYLILVDVRGSLLSMFQNSVYSVFFITPLIGLSSSSLGALIFRGKHLRALASIAIYVLIVMMLYWAYPGYLFLQDPAYNAFAKSIIGPFIVPILIISSFVFSFIIINAPYTRGEKSDRRTLSIRSAIVSAFFLAAENLKRRKFRTLLVTMMVLVSVASFISLTSLSYEGGLITEKINKKAPSQGIFLFQQSNNSEVYPFGPVESYILEWLNRSDRVSLISALLKNFPQISPSPGVPPQPLGSLINPQLGISYDVRGVMGVKPSLESTLIGINRIVEDDMNGFLDDEDINGILISEKAGETLKVKSGDTIIFCGMNFTVVGIFSSTKLKEIVDLNGDPVLPQEVFVAALDGGLMYTPIYVAPENVVILVSETAFHLPLRIIISRVIIQMRENEDMVSFARALALTFPRVETFASLSNRIIHFYIGYQLIEYGFAESFILLILTSINVGITFLTSVYERKHEVMTLSIIGLTPSQISAIFICEALIIALIAGSIGYLLGLMGYHILLNFPTLVPMVKYKVEAFWCILAIFFSMASSMIGALTPALKASIMTTPSLLRRFMIPYEGEKKNVWNIEIPIKIFGENNLLSFFNFMEIRLKDSGAAQIEERFEDIILEGDINNPESLSLHFHYKNGSLNINTKNKISATRRENNCYAITLSSRSLSPNKIENVRQTAFLVRRLALEYTEKEKMVFSNDGL